MSTEWPKHEDGTNKSVGEMTPEERRAAFRATAASCAKRGDDFGAAWFSKLAEKQAA
jgi:hypothetical protein